jgi:hypothetical protein
MWQFWQVESRICLARPLSPHHLKLKHVGKTQPVVKGPDSGDLNVLVSR